MSAPTAAEKAESRIESVVEYITMDADLTPDEAERLTGHLQDSVTNGAEVDDMYYIARDWLRG